MKALVYRGPGILKLEERPDPVVIQPTDAVVRLTTISICGTDLHILKGDVPSISSGRILGHEGVGIVEAVGPEVHDFRPGDRVLISLTTSCGRCSYCRKGMPSHCRSGGWILGNSIDGTQAEFVRIPFADNGLHHLVPEIDDEAAVLLSCNFPTSLECGTMAASVNPGDRVAIVGAGPVGLAALITCRLYSPSEVIMVDLNGHRLQTALTLGATHIVNATGPAAVEAVLALTKGEGVDAAIEAVGLPESFELCQLILAPGGRLANVGVHGKPVSLHLESLWSANLTFTTRLVDASTTARLLRMVRSGQIHPGLLITHRFAFGDILGAYDTFANATREKAGKMVVRVSE